MNIICIGDSLTEGYVTKNTARYYPYSTTLKRILSKKHKNIHVHNVGLSGKTSHLILQNLKRLDLTKYNIAIILAGTNDLLHKTNRYIMNKLKEIHNYCLTQGISHIYALSLPQIHFDRPLRESKRLILNSRLNTWCKSTTYITYIPFGEKFMYNKHSKIWAHNGYHLSPSGYKHMGEFISKKII